MKRKIIQFVLIIVCFVLQSTFLKSIAFANVAPNLMIILPALFGFMGGKREGIYVGFFTGFMFDLFYCDVVGLNAFVFMFIGYFSGFFKEHYNKEEMIIPLFLIMLGDFSYGFINYVFNFLLRNKLDIAYYMLNIILPEVVYTLFVTILIYKVVLYVDKLAGKKHERKVTKYVF